MATPVYKGKVIDTEHFRVYIYGADGARKLVESWNDYQKHMQTGIWFADKNEAKEMARIMQEQAAEAIDAAELVIPEKTKRGRKAKAEALAADDAPVLTEPPVIDEATPPENEFKSNFWSGTR